ncbi:MAG: DUF3021 domain-containing protein [Lachnospiraceae bacterium]|nr:DUF3021 domain-containing protein [Lachnospiraceae bacterium]
MKKLENLLFTFVCVTSCVVFGTAVYITIFWSQATLLVDILWQMLSVSFLTSLGVCFYPKKEVSAKSILIHHILYYIYVNVVVLGCGIWFGWFYADNLPMVLGMLILIALVFILVSIAIWNRAKKMAFLMNERLKGYQQKEAPGAESMDERVSTKGDV